MKGHLGEQVTPAVLLIGGDGDVQGVGIWLAVTLVDEAPREVEQVSRLQHHIKNRLPDLSLAEVG